MPDWKLGKRRRYQAVWASLVAFLVHSQEEGTLEEMGLFLDESQIEDILDVFQEVWMMIEEFENIRKEDGVLGGVWGEVQALLIGALIKSGSTARNNPLIWWTAILVRSATTGETDFISHGRFSKNPLPMDMDIRARVSALVHYSKVLTVENFLFLGRRARKADVVCGGWARTRLRGSDVDLSAERLHPTG